MNRNCDRSSGLRWLSALVVAIAMSASFVVVAAGVVIGDRAYADPVAATFSYTGTVETYTVPDGVNPVTIEMWGAQGGTCDGSDVHQGGLGGHVRATVAVTPGEVLEVRVGGAGGPLSGGFNGGGDGYAGGACGAGGGGATDVRQGGNALANRIVVAGGGGGNVRYQDQEAQWTSSPGGAGGGLQGGFGSYGGTQTSGGNGACATGGDGVEGVGGSSCFGSGGAGGGGWFGGGTGSQGCGADAACYRDGGGGGSGYTIPSATSVLNEAGIQSGDGFVTLTPAVPTPPRSLGVAVGDGQATLQWQPPASGTAGLIEYQVTPYEAGVAQTPQTFPPTTTTATITGLTNGTAYTFIVAAVNSVGTSPTAATQPLVVGAPAPLQSFAVAPGNTTAALSWVAPLHDNGSPVSDFVVQVFVGYVLQSQWNFDSAASSGTITGLTNGTKYGFRAAAENSRGAGQWSLGVVTVGTPTAPGTPVAIPSSEKAMLSWNQPVSDNGAGITGYTVVPYIAGVAQTARVLSSTATTATISGLTNGTSYRFTVAARNARGTGPVSPASAEVLVGTPTEPTSVAASAGNQQATVTWIAPADNGGSTITGYVVTPYKAGVAQMPRTYNSPATSQVVSSLLNGTSYTFAVAAKNARGTGPQSSPSSPITVGTPSAPRNSSAMPGNGSATVHWDPPATGNGGGVTGYLITPFLAGVAQPVRTYNSTATTEVVTGLTNTKAYTFKIAAKNGNGTGPRSIATAPIIVGAPTAPTGVSATAGQGSATVHWSAPSSNGAAISGYVVTPYRNGVVQASWNFGASSTTRTITGLTAGQTYTFKVAAKNSRGTGPQSVSSNAVTPT